MQKWKIRKEDYFSPRWRRCGKIVTKRISFIEGLFFSQFLDIYIYNPSMYIHINSKLYRLHVNET